MLTEAEIREFRERGYLVLRGRFREQAGVLREALQEMLDAPGGAVHYGRRFGPSGLAASHRFGGLMRSIPAFADYARDPDVLGIVTELLGPAEPFRDVVLSKPARSGGKLAGHQDLAYWDVGHDRVLTTWLAMTPALEASGALWLIPGSHGRREVHRTVLGGRRLPLAFTRMLRLLVSLTGTGDSPRNSGQRRWARLKEGVLEGITRRWPSLAGLGDLQVAGDTPASAAPVLVVAEPGDMVLFHGLTVHGSNANRLDSRRDAYLVTYVAQG